MPRKLTFKCKTKQQKVFISHKYTPVTQSPTLNTHQSHITFLMHAANHTIFKLMHQLSLFSTHKTQK